ncbi:hypothetical protein, partial [Deinococcus ficus]|uniref:hypothetical protein n=1 Tax=Deinococcus ficus TaxID=317577 RepID=UPI001E38F225
PPASEMPHQDAVTDQPDLETETGQTADTVSESDPAPAPGSELPRFTGRAAELYQRLLAGAELADNDPTFMVVMDGKAMGTVPRATAQRLLAVEGLLTQVAPGRWVITPALLP